MPGKLDGKVALIAAAIPASAWPRPATSPGKAPGVHHRVASPYSTPRRVHRTHASPPSRETSPSPRPRPYLQADQPGTRTRRHRLRQCRHHRAGPVRLDHRGAVDRVFGTNVKGLLFTAQKALPLMPAGGTIILAGSDVSIKGYPCQGVYPATKAAVRSFARTWTTDLKDRGIRVNVVSPGPVDTAMLAGHPEGTAMLAGQPEGNKGGGLACQHGAPGPSRGNRQDRYVPRLRRRQLHHRRRNLRRWREAQV